MIERLALDVAKWRDKDKPQIVADFASALIENREAPLEDRINTFSLTFNELEELARGLRHETAQDELENQGVSGVVDWAKRNEFGKAIWISSPSEEYSESRFIIFSIASEGGQKIVTLRPICGKQDKLFCLSISEQIAAFSPVDLPPLTSVDDLRKTVIPFDPKPYPDWIAFMEDVFGKSAIWEKIRKGDDIKQRLAATKVAEEIIGNNIAYISSAHTPREQVAVGAMLEWEAERYGIRIQTSGSCGISNVMVLNSLDRESPFSALYSGDITTEEKWEYHPGTCKVCGNKTQVGPCKICKICEKKF